MRWNLDTTHAEVEFAVKHLMISTVKGRFKTFSGTGVTNDDGSLKAVQMTIDTPSIDTNVTQRDDHLRSPDFFDAENFPTINFSSTGISHTGNDVAISGDLTIKGITKTVTLKGEFTAPTKDPWGNARSALAVGAKINRKEWGLGWNQLLEAGGVVVGEEVKLTIEVEAVAVQDAAPVAVEELATAAA